MHVNSPVFDLTRFGITYIRQRRIEAARFSYRWNFTIKTMFSVYVCVCKVDIRRIIRIPRASPATFSYRLDSIVVRSVSSSAPEFHAKSVRERVVRRVGEQREGKLSNAHTARVLRRANARWPGKRCRRSQGAGIES